MHTVQPEGPHGSRRRLRGNMYRSTSRVGGILLSLLAVVGCGADARDLTFSFSTPAGGSVEISASIGEGSDERVCVEAVVQHGDSDGGRRQLFSKDCFDAPTTDTYVVYSSVSSSAGGGAELDVVAFVPPGADFVTLRASGTDVGTYATSELEGAISADPRIFVVSELVTGLDAARPIAIEVAGWRD